MATLCQSNASQNTAAIMKYRDTHIS